jgi:hypothetical protein
MIVLRPLPPALVATLGFGAYLLLAHLTFGNRPEQIVLCAVMCAACLGNDRSRRFFRGMLPFLLFGIVYDCLKLLGSHLPGLAVQVAWPYRVDRALFGFIAGGARLSAGEFFGRYHAAAVDFVCGIAYLLYVYVAVGLGIYLALGRSPERHRLLARYGWSFFFVNLAAFLTYLALPVAPPWYVAGHGLGPADLSTHPDPAALARWDALTGLPLFATIYARSSDVFGSVPSLHCAYPMMAYLYARELGKRWLNVALLAFWAVVVFSAVYLQHHYLLDTALGTAYALAGRQIERAITSRGARPAALQAASGS